MSYTVRVRKVLRWGDKGELKSLIDEGVLVPMPKHTMCLPAWDECKRCWFRNKIDGVSFWFKCKLGLEEYGIPLYKNSKTGKYEP